MVWLLGLGLAASLWGPLAPPQEVASTITDVTVFQQGAQVTRTATARVPSGTTDLVFMGLTAALDPASVQVRGDGAFVVLSVTHRLDYLTEDVSADSVALLQTLLQARRDTLAYEQRVLDVYDRERQLVVDNRNVGGEEGVQAAALEATADFMRRRLLDLHEKRLTLQRRIRSLRDEIGRLEAQLRELGGQQTTSTPVSEVVVKMQAAQATQGRFTLTYRVADASWSSRYDLRVEAVGEPVNLTYYADVQQASDEPWNDVRLTLSTGNPAQSTMQPELAPWRLGFLEEMRAGQARVVEREAYNSNPRRLSGVVYDAQGEVLIGASVLVVGTQNGTVTNIDGRYNLAVPEGLQGQSVQVAFIGYETITTSEVTAEVVDFYLPLSLLRLDEVVVTGVVGDEPSGRGERPHRNRAERSPRIIRQQQATTTTFAIDLPYTIPADGNNYSVEIAENEVAASYQYAAVPKRELAAFLTAGLTDWARLDLVSGPANLFFEGTYIGESYLDTANLSDTLTVSLGRDPGVVIERELDEQFAARNFLRNRTTDQRGYTITVRNNKRVPVTIMLEDQVPVSIDELIAVRAEPGERASYDDETGLLTWQLTLPPNTDDTVAFRYEVRYPKGRRVVLE